MNAWKTIPESGFHPAKLGKDAKVVPKLMMMLHELNKACKYQGNRVPSFSNTYRDTASRPCCSYACSVALMSVCHHNRKISQAASVLRQICMPVFARVSPHGLFDANQRSRSPDSQYAPIFAVICRAPINGGNVK